MIGIKRKILFFVCITGILFTHSCGTTTVKENMTPATESVPTRFTQLASLYKGAGTDTLYIFSAANIEDPAFSLRGTAMDSAHVWLLPYNLRASYEWNKDFGACFQFAIDSLRTGLVTRLPSEYVSSAIKLLVFDHPKDSVTNSIDLADTFGDAGDVSEYSSCLFHNKERNLLLLTYHWSSYDHSVEDTADTRVDRWYNYSLYKISGDALDTLSKDSAEIIKQYPGIIRKLSGKQN